MRQKDKNSKVTDYLNSQDRLTRGAPASDNGYTIGKLSRRGEVEALQTTALGRFWALALWTVGPWACGGLTILAAAIVRALFAAHGYIPLDLRLHGRYVVAARAHVIGVLALAVIAAATIIMLLSKRIEL